MQSVANQGLVNRLFQPFTVIYLVVRSLIVWDLVDNLKPHEPALISLINLIDSLVIDFVVWNLNLTDYTKGEFTNIWMLGAKADSHFI